MKEIEKRLTRLENDSAYNWIKAETATIFYKDGTTKRCFGDVAIDEALNHPERIESITGGGGELPALAAVFLLTEEEEQ